MKNYNSLDRSKLCKEALESCLKNSDVSKRHWAGQSYVHTISHSFCALKKSNWIGLLFTRRKNGFVGAISVTNRSCTALIDL